MKLVCDEIFGRQNFINSITWQKIHSTKNDARYLSENHDFILLYAKNKELVAFNLLERTDEMNSRYKNPDNDPRGAWQSGDLVAAEERTNGYYDVISPKSGKIFNVPQGKHWVYTQENMEQLIADNRIWFGKDGNSFPRKKRFLTDVMQGKKCTTWWESSDVGHNDVPGTSGGFDYYELGEPLMFANGNINESVETSKIRDYVWYMETKQSAQTVDLSDNPYLLGVTGGTVYYFNYEKDTVTTLDTAFLETLNTKAERYVIYADQCALPDETLSRWSITFKKIPRDIAKL